MGGTNPYIKPVATPLPRKKYQLTIIDEQGQATAIQVDPTKIPYYHTGQPGSILDIALGSGVLIDHACGGVCACSTCHVYVQEGMPSLNEPTDDELDQLEEAPGIKPNSRLACQSVPNGSTDVIVVIPTWNRNLVKEKI